MRRLVAIALACGASSAAAQLHLPQVQVPQAPLQLPQVPLQLPRAPADVTALPGGATRGIRGVLDPTNLLDSRRLAIGERLRLHHDALETDPAGELIVRSEVILVAPSVEALDTARALGYTVAVERAIGRDNRIVVLRAPRGVATPDAVNQLRALDPQGQYDFNHVYVPAGATGPDSAGTRSAPAELRAPSVRGKIGLIDGGLDLRHPALRGADIRTSGCSTGPIPSVHGTAIASLLVGRTRGFGGAAQGATLYAADVYCDSPTGGTASMIVEALAWMAREQVPVINISLVGPANRALEATLRALIARGHVIVAAVGNDGPASPPLYPAAYPDVIAVTAVDVRKQVLPEAIRGPHVAFCAPGAEMAVAASGESGFSKARGTSFAAPLVAGLLAVAYDPAGGPQAGASRRAVAALVQDAVDLGVPGRDPIYGHGLVGERLRVDPVALR